MAYGLQVWDSTGKLKVDTSLQAARFNTSGTVITTEVDRVVNTTDDPNLENMQAYTEGDIERWHVVLTRLSNSAVWSNFTIGTGQFTIHNPGSHDHAYFVFLS